MLKFATALTATVILTGILAPAVSVQAYPEPSIVERAWAFEFSHGQPQPIGVRTSTGELRWYWYMTYRVTNRTGEERIFAPEVTIATDEGDIIPAGRDVPPSVFDAIKQRERNPLLESPMQAVGRLLQGNDNARDSVVVWPAFKHEVELVSIFITGLSGETQKVQSPAGEELVVRKTLMLDFAFPGQPPHPQDQNVLPRGERWIMR